MNTILEMIHYVENDVLDSSPSMMRVQSLVGEYRLQVLCITLLDWMRLQHRFKKLRPLELNPEHGWVQTLHSIASDILWSEVFEDVFEIKDGKLDFHSSLTREQKLEFCATVFREHKPRLMT